MGSRGRVRYEGNQCMFERGRKGANGEVVVENVSLRVYNRAGGGPW